MFRVVKRAVLGTVGFTAVAAIAAVVYVRGVIPGTDGCVLRSVDKREYMARNDAVFRTIPVPRLLREEADTNTWVHGIPAQNPCIPIGDTGPPYDTYITTHVYLQKPGGRPIGYDERLLGRRWVRQSGDNFRRGDASLNISGSGESVMLRVDHRGYADEGH